MKKYFFYAAAAFAIASLAGCKNDNLEEETPQGPEINGEATMTLETPKDVVLDKTKPTEAALTFAWTAARELPEEYVLTYTAELNLASNKDWSAADKKELDADVLTLSYTNADLQKLLVETWKQTAGTAVELQFRVTASWTGGTEKAEPEVQTVKVKVTPYAEEGTEPEPEEPETTITITPSADNVTLEEAKDEEVALSFTWTIGTETPEGYTLTYTAELTKATDAEFADAKKTENIAADAAKAEYLTKDLQQWITEEWLVNGTAELAFRVTANYAGEGEAIEPVTAVAKVKVTTYTPAPENVELTDFTVAGATFDGAGISDVSATQAYENEALYAALQTLTTGELTIAVTDGGGRNGYLAPAEGEGAFSDGTAVEYKVMSQPFAWGFSENDENRLIINTTEKTLTIYASENEFNKPYYVEFNYEKRETNGWTLARTCTSGNYYMRSNDSGDSWAGKPYNFTQSLADPQVLVCTDKVSFGSAKFHIKLGITISDYVIVTEGTEGGNPNTDSKANVSGRGFGFAPLEATNSIGGSDMGYPYVSGEWMPMEAGVSINKKWWTFPNDTKVDLSMVIIDLRNMRAKFVSAE